VRVYIRYVCVYVYKIVAEQCDSVEGKRRAENESAAAVTSDYFRRSCPRHNIYSPVLILEDEKHDDDDDVVVDGEERISY